MKIKGIDRRNVKKQLKKLLRELLAIEHVRLSKKHLSSIGISNVLLSIYNIKKLLKSNTILIHDNAYNYLWFNPFSKKHCDIFVIIEDYKK